MIVNEKDIVTIVEDGNPPFEFDPNSKGAQRKLSLANRIGLGEIRSKSGNSRKLTVVKDDEPTSYGKRVRIAAYKRAAASGRVAASKSSSTKRSVPSKRASSSKAANSKKSSSSRSPYFKGRSSAQRSSKK